MPENTNEMINAEVINEEVEQCSNPVGKVILLAFAGIGVACTAVAAAFGGKKLVKKIADKKTNASAEFDDSEIVEEA